MSEKPLVSIVVPIYNMGAQLKVAAKTLLAQTYKNIEIILIDDGSSDDTASVCKKLQSMDSRVSYFYQKNRGSGPARNKGIENAHGKYIYFADADDVMSNDLIEKVVNHMESKDCDMAVFGFKRVFKDGSEKDIAKLDGEVFSGEDVRSAYHKFYDNNSKSGVQGAPWNKMFRLDVIRKYELFYPALRRHQDEVFIMSYVNRVERIVFINDVLYLHNTNDRESIFRKIPKNYFDMVSSLNKYRMFYIHHWNKNNDDMLDIICHDFVYATGLALMFTFNPNFEYSPVERYLTIKKIAKQCMFELPDEDYTVNSTMFKLMSGEHYALLYFAAYMGLRKYY